MRLLIDLARSAALTLNALDGRELQVVFRGVDDQIGIVFRRVKPFRHHELDRPDAILDI